MQDLQSLLHKQGLDIKVSSLRWWLYQLSKEAVIGKVGYGKYKFGHIDSIKIEISDTQKRIDRQIKRSFPNIGFCQWSTTWLHQFMRHQPTTHINLIEVERDVCESVFNAIQEVKAKVFFMPNQKSLETMVFNTVNPTIVIPLISESPLDKRSKYNVPRIEKIIVDLISDSKIYAFYQGQELKNIMEEIQEKSSLNMSMMLRYAKRRHKQKEVEKIINIKANI